MLNNLSPMERETLVTLGNKGPGGDFDQLSLNKLFTLGLIEVNSNRQIVLTPEGRKLANQLAPNA